MTSKAEPYCSRRHQIIVRPAIQNFGLFWCSKLIVQTYWLCLSTVIFVALNASCIPQQYHGEDKVRCAPLFLEDHAVISDINLATKS
jgi:hypothetical protein